ncbi:MAG: hypothetical protein SWO11_04045 [Thermodesulfobacteriota bacterium]|nr:hypothetical protein [Thermodesulfobacteriota bacterium]
MLKIRSFRIAIGLILLVMVVLSCNDGGGSKSKKSVADLIPPVLSNGSPTGTLLAGTTEATLSLNTDEGATCRYDVLSGIDYSSMSSIFQSTDGMIHFTDVPGLEDGQSYTYYIRCEDASGNMNEVDYPISFSVSSSLDLIPPVLSNGSPTGTLLAGTTEATLSLNTDEGATCRYDVLSGIDYSSMSSIFQSTDGMIHFTDVPGLEDGQSYTYYIRCEDASGNMNEVDYTITFSVDVMRPTVTINNIYTMYAGNKFHSTSRGTIDLVYHYNGVWFVFHGASQDPCCEYNGYQTSSDGITWSSLKTGNVASNEMDRSFLCEGNKITRLFRVDTNPDPNTMNQNVYIGEGIINGSDIVWDIPELVLPAGSTGDNYGWYYYNDLRRDTTGRIHFSGRHNDNANNIFNIFWVRAQNPFDNSVWENPTTIVAGDFASTGVDGHENVQLDGDEVYIIARTNSLVYSPGNPGKFYGRHFDGMTWESVPTELGLSDGISGSDKRLCALFDPDMKRIHFVYIDDNSNLFHRTLSTPYDSSDWSAPVFIESNVFTCSMGIDTSSTPSRIALVYGKQLATDGGRFHTGELYLKWFDGKSWDSNSLLVSESGTFYNWYPNMIRDVSGDIGIMYLKGRWDGNSPVIMFSLIQY